jgi:hypothetical protein
MQKGQFQPTPPRRERPRVMLSTKGNYLGFQPTHTRGERRSAHNPFGNAIKFQPTPPRGERRRVSGGDDHILADSTHAPTRGERQQPGQQDVDRPGVSTHAPRGERPPGEEP